jgi:hypothetical protein
MLKSHDLTVSIDEGWIELGFRSCSSWRLFTSKRGEKLGISEFVLGPVVSFSESVGANRPARTRAFNFQLKRAFDDLTWNTYKRLPIKNKEDMKS